MRRLIGFVVGLSALTYSTSAWSAPGAACTGAGQGNCGAGEYCASNSICCAVECDRICGTCGASPWNTCSLAVAAGTACTDTAPGDCEDAQCATGGACDQDYADEAVSYVCNAVVAGECDVQDTCNTGGGACPAKYNTAGTACTDTTTGDCWDSGCNGSGTCNQLYVAEGTSYVCDPSDAGECDIPDTCNAAGSLTCPAKYNTAGTACTDTTTGDCWDSGCNGSGVCNQLYVAEGTSYVCDPSDAGECDIPDTCNAAGSLTCPAKYNTAGTACIDTTTGDCWDSGCNGTGTCNQLYVAEGTSYVCDPSDAGECDIPDTCNAAGSLTCPAKYNTAGTACIDTTTGDCWDSGCNGTGTCNQLYVAELTSYVCNSADAGECDVPDTCNAGGGACPTKYEPNGTQCTDSTPTDCDDAQCNVGVCVQTYGDELTSYVCNSADAGQCDVPDTCNAGGGACPAKYEPNNTLCTDSTTSDCWDARCDGSGACNQQHTAEGTAYVCNSTVSGPCDLADTCGAAGSTTCPPKYAANGTVCADTTTNDCWDSRCDGSGACNQQHTAEGTAYVCNSTVSGPCDIADTCNAAGSTTCPPKYAANGTVCADTTTNDCWDSRCDGSGACNQQHTAEGTAYVCNAAVSGLCDVADNCDATGSTTCPARYLAGGTECRASTGTCDLAESCTGASNVCPPDTTFAASDTLCRASTGTCDLAENCTGSSNTCPLDTSFAPSDTPCRSVAGICDVAENCTGSSNTCPADFLVSASITCRAAVGVCDAAESCTGLAPECPADAKLVGTICRAAAHECDAAESCDGSGDGCLPDLPADDGLDCANACLSAGACLGGACRGASRALVAPDPLGELLPDLPATFGVTTDGLETEPLVLVAATSSTNSALLVDPPTVETTLGLLPFALSIDFSPPAYQPVPGFVALEVRAGAMVCPDTDVSFAAFGGPASLDLSPATVDFGDVRLDANVPVARTLRATNVGVDTLAVFAVTIEGDGFGLAEDLGFPIWLDPGAELDIRLNSLPTELGPVRGRVIVEATAPGLGAATRTLVARGTRTTTIVTAAELDFGTLPIGGPPVIATVGVGDADVRTVLGAVIEGDAGYTLVSAPTDIQIGALGVFVVSYVPLVESPGDDAVLVVELDGLPTVRTALRGRGVLPAARVEPLDVTFADLDPGGSAIETLRIENAGAAAIVLGGPGCGPLAASDGAFTVAAATTALAPGEETTLDVTFAPTTSGRREAALELFDCAGAPAPLARVELTGVSVRAPLLVAPGELVLGSVPVGAGAWAPAAVAITNLGSVAVTLDHVCVAPAGSDSCGAAEFSVAGLAPGTTLAPGAALQLDVGFTPAGNSWRDADLLVFVAGDTSPQRRVHLLGDGIDDVLLGGGGCTTAPRPGGAAALLLLALLLPLRRARRRAR